MKRRKYLYGSTLMLLLFAASCAGNLETMKHQGEASRNLGEAYMVQGDYTSALRELLQAEKLYPNDPFLQNNLGLTYMARERLDLAIRHFNRALELKPDYAPARNNLGTVYLAKEDWDSAIATFNKLTGDLLYATPHFPLYNLGWAYFNKRDYPRAEKYYLEALKVEPRFAIAFRGLGNTYAATGRTGQAIEQFEKGVKLAPNFPELHMDLAKAYTRARDYKKATASYQKVIELTPDSPLAREAKAEVEKILRLGG
jgi:tetratricopeptide (TPR) repeat protein